ncbi:MAG: DnaD domain protein [Firmicutes bacterium]|nr:DnaD domain protein [Bacillota bacterium]
MNTMFEALDLKHLLLDHYKALGFQEKHVMVILVMDQLLKLDNHLITAELLSLKMTLPLEEIDATMVELLNRKFIEYVTVSGKTHTTLNPLKQLLYKRFQQQVIHQTQELTVNAQANLFQRIEKEFGRTLSPLEISRIQDWLQFGYSEAIIISSLEEAIAKQKKSIRFMDKYLQKQTTKENFNLEGNPSIQQNPHQDIQKTITQINENLDHGSKQKK